MPLTPEARLNIRIANSLYALLTLGVLYTLYLAHQILLPIVLAILVSLLLSPFVDKAKRYGIPRFVAAFSAVMLLLAVLVALFSMVFLPALDWIEQAPEQVSRFVVGDNALTQRLDRIARSTEEVEQALSNLNDDAVPTVVVQTESWQSQVFAVTQRGVAGLALSLALVYFLLVSGKDLVTNIANQLVRRRRVIFLRIVKRCQQHVTRFLAVITGLNIIIGTLTGLLCWWFDLPSPALWGMIAGVARFIPYLGVMTGLSVITLVAVSSIEPLWFALLVPVGFLIITVTIGFFLEPYVHGYRTSINPVVIFTAIFFWGWLWGPIGVLMAVPLMTIIHVILGAIPATQAVQRAISRPRPNKT